MQRYYFDYAASTPVDPAVVKVMAPFWTEKFGNPGSLHFFGQEASAAVFESRDMIAKSLGCHYSEIVFTGSATEANNLAIRGVVKSFPSEKDPPPAEKLKVESIKNPKIITSSIEHDSILGTCRELSSVEGSALGGKNDVEVVYLPVSKNGIVDLKKLESALDDRTVLVSIMYANNEIGSIQPITEISNIIRNFREVKGQRSKVKGQEAAYPLLHTDAVQAFNYLSCNVEDLGVDLLTLSAQKIYGPKGIGALYVRQNNELRSVNNERRNPMIHNSQFIIHPMITGGGQEGGMRSGTENVPGIVGFAKAVEIADKLREKENKRLLALREYFLKEIRKINSKIELNGDLKNRLPNNINIYVPPKSGGKGTAQDLLIKLDLAGFAVSPGSACSARTCTPSHVLKALGYSDEKAMSGLRITFGRQTDKRSVIALLKELNKKLS